MSIDKKEWGTLETYLKEQYDVLEDRNYLRTPEEIEEYFRQDPREFFDCGLGYYQDEVQVLVHIANKFYRVTLKARIGASNADYGDRIYFVEKLEKVEYEEIEKPERKTEYYNLRVSELDLELAQEILEKAGIELKGVEKLKV